MKRISLIFCIFAGNLLASDSPHDSAVERCDRLGVKRVTNQFYDCFASSICSDNRFPAAREFGVESCTRGVRLGAIITDADRYTAGGGGLPAAPMDRAIASPIECSGTDVSRWTNCYGTATAAWGKYAGEYRGGKPHGQGVFTWASGRYVGEHRDGKRHGQGVLTYVDGRPPLEGIWADNQLVRAERIPDNIAGRASSNTATIASSQVPAIEVVPRLRTWIWVRDADEQVREFAVAAGERVIFRDMPIYLVLARPGESEVKIFGRAVKLEKTDKERDIGRFGRSELLALVPSIDGPVKQRTTVKELTLSVSSSRANADGVVLLTISTGSDTASLKVNGDEEGGRADGRYSVRRFARVGENKFEVVATDRFGNTKTQVVSVVREPADTTVRFATLNPGALRGKPANNAVAIIIGIQDYRRVPKAEFANNDARVFYDYAIRGLGVRPENVKLLVDQQADDVEILGAFKNWLPLKAKRGQTDVYVFYSGHGLPSDDGASLYFLPHGVDRQFLDRTAIKQAEIVSALQAVQPKSVTLFLDACYSGQSRGGETLLASARPIAIQPKASTFPSNFTVLSASAPEQIASSSPDLKHGIFSYFLMKGMEGEADQNKDGSITVQEMQGYLSDSVGGKAMSINRTQQPQVVGDQSRVLVGR